MRYVMTPMLLLILFLAVPVSYVEAQEGAKEILAGLDEKRSPAQLAEEIRQMNAELKQKLAADREWQRQKIVSNTLLTEKDLRYAKIAIENMRLRTHLSYAFAIPPGNVKINSLFNLRPSKDFDRLDIRNLENRLLALVSRTLTVLESVEELKGQVSPKAIELLMGLPKKIFEKGEAVRDILALRAELDGPPKSEEEEKEIMVLLRRDREGKLPLFVAAHHSLKKLGTLLDKVEPLTAKGRQTIEGHAVTPAAPK